jgi:protein SCO1/2
MLMHETERRMAGPYLEDSLSLLDHDGQSVVKSTLQGAYSLFFFGFTHCGMVCPRALRRLTDVLERLGPLAGSVRAYYVTVDPGRDTPAVMKAFLQRDYPKFTGLTGTREEIEAIKQSFRVHSRKASVPDADPESYVVPHSAFTYLMDSDGRYLAHFTDAVGTDELYQQLIKLIT